ncbi:MAG: response regulator [Thermodesulfobacteriota bacterium]
MSPDKQELEPARSNHAAAAPIRLLLVDDEKGYVDVLSNRLSHRRIQVAKAYSGEEAIQAVRGRDFDVVVLDLKMEGMDGIEVLKILKKMDPKLVVIMLTGHGSEETARQGIAAGAFDYLTKPCELDDLLAKIREAYLSRKPGIGG